MKFLLLLTVFTLASFQLEAMELKISTKFSGDAKELFDGKASTGVSFKGYKEAPVKVEFILALDAPAKLDYVELVSTSPNKWWNIKSFQLYADTAANNFELLKEDKWYSRDNDNSRKSFTNKISLNGRKVKKLILVIKRSHPYLYMNLSEIKMVTPEGKVIAGELKVVPYIAEAHETDAYNDNVSQPVVDRYGQYINESWPGKVTSDQQLHKEYQQEAEALKNVRFDPEKFDKFGGVKQYQLEATGVFRVEQWKGKWWFVTPEGHPYIMNGPGAVNPDEWGYGTPLYRGAEQEISRKHLFTSLPDRSEMPQSYHNSSKRGVSVNFLMANIYRKYGADYEKKFAEIIYKRLISWGFNCYGKWSSVQMFFRYGYKLPYIAGMGIRTEKKIKWAVDPFDPETLDVVRKGVAKAHDADKDNPWLIGYFFWSESGWNRSIVKALIEDDKYTSTPAAKEFRKFLVDRLKEKYGDDTEKYQTALEVQLKSADAVLDPANKLKWTGFMDSVAGDFIRYAGKVFFGMVRREYDQAGGKHLLLGSALTPYWRNDIEWSEGGAEFLDVVSVDYYGHEKKRVLRYAQATNKPVINIEFNFSTKGRGMRNFHGGCVKVRKDKGSSYSRMLENCVADNYVIGFNPFVLFDQPVTGRTCSNEGTWGENFNTGFINTADQPYVNYLKAVKETNNKLFDIHLGTTKPVTYTDWKNKKTIWRN